MSIAACVLAAGSSRRMGTSKALLEIDGQTFVERLLAAFHRAGATPLFVVAPAGSTAIRPACAAHAARCLINPDPDRGMLSSLHVCLREILDTGAAGSAPRIDGLFVAPVDCPRVRSETIAALARAFETSGAPIVVPRFGARRGHPTLFSAGLFTELLHAPLDVGARSVVWAHAADRLEVPVDDEAVLDDIDSPAAAARLGCRVTREDEPA